MKRLISTLLLTVSIAAAALAQPQNNNHRGHGKPDFEKFQAEKVAFITNEVGLTAEEAEDFWPVFNEIEKQQKERMMAEKKAYIALNKALAEGQGDVATQTSTPPTWRSIRRYSPSRKWRSSTPARRNSAGSRSGSSEAAKARAVPRDASQGLKKASNCQTLID